MEAILLGHVRATVMPGNVGVGHTLIDSLTAPRTVLFRQEGSKRCQGCDRLHEYSVGRFQIGRPVSEGIKVLFDSYDDAAAQIQHWLREAAPDQVVAGWARTDR